MAKPQGDPNARPVFIMDTNVFLDIHSCHDVKRDFDKLHSELGDAAVDDPKIVYRRARARESMLLAMYLHKIKGTTMSLRHEAIELLMKCAPPKPGGTEMEGDFTRVFAHFVQPFCLRGWNSVVTTEHGSVRRNDADRAHVALAKSRSIPLVTNEGASEDGSVDDSKLIRVEARAAGVTVLTPRQAFESLINEEEEIESFLARFKDRAPNYLARRGIRDRMGDVLAWVFGLYRFILRGEVEGHDAPAAVRLR